MGADGNWEQCPHSSVTLVSTITLILYAAMHLFCNVIGMPWSVAEVAHRELASCDLFELVSHYKIPRIKCGCVHLC